MTKVYARTNHWVVVTVVLKTDARVGMATVTMLMSKVPMNVPMQARTSRNHLSVRSQELLAGMSFIDIMIALFQAG